jgi:hypothetical protein
MCQSLGSLKTEEKTERQCGQFVVVDSFDRDELLVNFWPAFPCRPTRIHVKVSISLQHIPLRRGALDI